MEFHWAKSHPHKRTTSPSTLIGIDWCSSSRWKEINNRIHWRCHCEEQCVVCSVKAAQYEVAAERTVNTGPPVVGDPIVWFLFVLSFVWSCNKQQLCWEGQLLLLVTVDNEILSFMEKKTDNILGIVSQLTGHFCACIPRGPVNRDTNLPWNYMRPQLVDIDCTVSLFEIITMPDHKALADNLTLF